MAGIKVSRRFRLWLLLKLSQISPQLAKLSPLFGNAMPAFHDRFLVLGPGTFQQLASVLIGVQVKVWSLVKADLSFPQPFGSVLIKGIQGCRDPVGQVSFIKTVDLLIDQVQPAEQILILLGQVRQLLQ